MGNVMTEEAGEIDALLTRAGGGDCEALALFWERHRKRLRQMIRLRLDRRLQGLVDPSDVLQEAYIDLAHRLPHIS
jgi:RNA polymerase sigma-70 factor (ECF subfamily)